MDMDTSEAKFKIIHPTIMATPWFMVTVLGLYLYFVTNVGPNFMKFRQPYKLKKLIIVHNIVQVVSCIYVVFEILHITERNIIYFWKCSYLEETPERMKRHFSLAYFLFWLKFSELIETVIFVLRKKQNQVTKLHVFHHLTTITLIYLLINYNEKSGCDALFPVFINSVIHIIMYSYYLIAAVADKSVVRALMPVKKSITVMQMVQFTLILFHAGNASIYCSVDSRFFSYFIFVIVLMFYGFYDFYTKSYISPSAAAEVQTKVK